MGENIKRVFTWLVLVCLFFAAATVCMLSMSASSADGGAYSTLKMVVYGIVLLAIALSMICLYGKRLQERIKPEQLYLIVGIAFCMIYMLMIPICVVPDETSHMFTAYDLSNRMMGIGDGAETTVLARYDDATFQFRTMKLDVDYLKEYYGSFFDGISDDSIVESNTFALDAPGFLYFFAALGITLGRILGCGTIVTLLLGRAFNAAVFVWAVYYSIKKIPFGKCVLFVWALLPMVLQQAGSYSYDSGILTMCVLVTALTLRFLYSEEKAKKSEITIYVLAVLLLIPCKGHALLPVSAFSLTLLVKLTRRYKEEITGFVNKHKKLLKKIVIICGVVILTAAALAIALLVRHLTSPEQINSRYIAYADSPGYTLGYFILYPGKLVLIIYQTLRLYGAMYLRQMIGDYLGWLEIRISVLPVIIYIILLIAACIREKNEKVYIGMGTRIYMYIIFVAVCGLAIVAMLLYWTPRDSYTVAGIQGRYFLPALPIALIACRNSRVCRRPCVDKIIMLATVYIQVFVMASYFRNFG